MPPKKSEKPTGRAGATSRSEFEDHADKPQRLNLGCGTLLIAVILIVLLGKFLPHEPRRTTGATSTAAPAKLAAKPVAKVEVPPEEAKPKPAPAKKPTPASEPARPTPAKPPPKSAPRDGAVVFNDPWTGAVSQVEHYLKRSLHDAQSFEALEWGQVAATKQGYKVRCTYRAKNVLGVYATQTKTFLLNQQGEVYAVREKE